MLSSWSEAARWKTEKMFFHPERMFAAWELTIWAIQRTTMSRMVGDLNGRQSKEVRRGQNKEEKEEEGRSQRQHTDEDAK